MSLDVTIQYVSALPTEDRGIATRFVCRVPYLQVMETAEQIIEFVTCA
jgi:hypothetical protein